jgi:predicted transcriptional regulator
MKRKLFDETLTLTKAEEQIMQLLWKKKHAFVSDLLDLMPMPKPAVTTVSTIVRILVKKGFVGHRPLGRAHQYFPLISQTEYLSCSLSRLSNTYFQNSYANLVNFFVEEKKLKPNEIEEIRELLKNVKTGKK